MLIVQQRTPAGGVGGEGGRAADKHAIVESSPLVLASRDDSKVWVVHRREKGRRYGCEELNVEPHARICIVQPPTGHLGVTHGSVARGDVEELRRDLVRPIGRA